MTGTRCQRASGSRSLGYWIIRWYRSASSVRSIPWSANGSQNVFRDVTEPQRLGWPEIQAGHDVLISAPTGSGKTLAAFLIALDELVRTGPRGELPNQTEVLYVSPLKALSNDVHKNLEIPLAGIAELARAEGVRARRRFVLAVRTGDTPAAERQRMAQGSAAHSGDHAGIALHSADGREVAARCCARCAR